MKKYSLIFLILSVLQLNAQQPLPKSYQQQLDKVLTPAQKKKLEQQIKNAGMNGGLTAEYKKMMNAMMTTPKDEVGFDLYENFTDNKQLVPPKQTAKIKSIGAKLNSNEEVVANIKSMYGKLMLKLPAAEKSLITKIVAGYTNGSELTSAAVTALLQGRNQVAMGLAMQAVIAEPGNLVYQNNLAAILTDNGYPENAIPFLRKLDKEVSNNSTVLNNLGYAWLNLGETDSAKHFFSAGGMANPEHPDIICGNGLMEELAGGDPGEIFEEAFKKAPNSIAEKLANNVGKINLTDKLDFEKIKNKIPVHEYFYNFYTLMPEFSNTATNCQHDVSMQLGYAKMYEEYGKEIGAITDTLERKLRVEAQGSVTDKYKKAQIRPGMGGAFARYVYPAISRYLNTFLPNYIQERDSVEQHVNDRQKELDKALELIQMKHLEKDAYCEAENEEKNKYLEEVNPVILKFYVKKQEEFRIWLNAFITYTLWDQRISMNVRLRDCWAYIRIFFSYHVFAVNSLRYECSSCRPPATEDSMLHMKSLKLPKIDCPVNINIPLGMDNLGYLNSNKDFNNNKYNIKKAGNGRSSNITVAIAASNSGIAEPGKDGQPYVKATEGNMSVQGFSVAAVIDREIDRLQSEIKLRKLKKYLSDMITIDCNNPNENKAPKSKKNKDDDDLQPLTPVLNNSVQSPGSNKGAIPGLFK